MMRAQLDPNLKQAVAVGTPVEVVDMATNDVYYLISAEQFRLLSSISNRDIDPCVARLSIGRSGYGQ